jgi:hypothetical protein
MADLKSRLRNWVQITTDGHQSYVAAVGLTFGNEVDWAQLQKIYAPDMRGERRYSLPVCTGTKVRVLKGDPDPRPDINELRRAPEPLDADGDAPLLRAYPEALTTLCIVVRDKRNAIKETPWQAL